jgi:hypothetical protein
MTILLDGIWKTRSNKSSQRLNKIQLILAEELHQEEENALKQVKMLVDAYPLDLSPIESK